jgi:PAS domain S-box-containing protein
VHSDRDGSSPGQGAGGGASSFDQQRALLKKARLVLHSEVRKRHQAELRAALESAVTRVLVAAPSFPEAVPNILKALVLGAGWDAGEVWLLADYAQSLRWTTFYSKTNEPALGVFRAASEGTVLQSGRGFPWRAWASGQPVWGHPVGDDLGGVRASAMRKAGFRTALATPFHGGEGTSGVLTLYRFENQETDPGEVAYLTKVLHQVVRLGTWKWGEGALADLESRTRAFVESYPLPALVVDAQGRLRFVSSSARSLLGEEAMAGVKTVRDLPRELALFTAGSKEPYPLAKLPIVQAMNGEASYADDLEVRRDGRNLFLEAWATPVKGDSGRVEYAIAVYVDITQLRLQRQELEKAREEAQAADRAKTDFVSRMSHEIRTPLNAILGSVDLLWETPLTQDQQEYVRLCREAGQGLMSLISNILDLSRVQEGKLELASTPFSLEEFVEKTISMFSLRAHQKGLELSYYVEAGVPERVVGDPVRLRQVLVNLLGNAIKFTEKGHITVRVRTEPGAKDPGRLLFTVQDTGIGIPPDRLGAIFERFVQASSSTAAEYGGSGLGLTISKHLVETMGGRIWVDSNPGEGSTFSFIVHLEPAAGTALRTVRAELKGVRVLVVDGAEQDRKSLHEILSEQATTVTLSDSGKEAVQEFDRAKAEGTPYQLVVLADELADGPSFDTARAIVERVTPGQVIFLSSANRTRTNAPRLRELGISNQLPKPVERGALLALASSAMRAAKVIPRGGRRASEKSGAAEAPHLQELRILLAEDSEDNRFIMQRFLRNTSCRIDVAENGKVALDKFIQGEYDLVLMDLQMPFMDGFTATKSIREWEKRRGAPPTPIIALSAYAIKEEVERSLAAGCDAHITKPIDKAKLFQILGNYGRKAAA